MFIRWGSLLATGVLALSACSDAPPERRFMGELLRLEMYTQLDSPVTTEFLGREEDRSSAARGRAGGYRRAIVFRHTGADCSPHRDAVACGAKLEIFRTADRARHRVRALAVSETGVRPGESRIRRGALLLRVSGQLPQERRADYRRAFAEAVTSLPGRFQEKADIRSSDPETRHEAAAASS